MLAIGKHIVIICAFALFAVSCTTKDQEAALASVELAPDSVLNGQADSLFLLSLKLAKKHLADSALVIQQKVLGLRLSCRTHDARLAYAYWRTARLLSTLGHFDAAEQKIVNAMNLAEEFSVPGDSLISMILLASSIKADLTDDASALSLANYAERLANGPPVNPALLRSCMIALGVIHNRAGRYEESIMVHRKVITLLDKEADKGQLATMYFNIAMCYYSMLGSDSCLVNLDKSFALRIRLDGPLSTWISSIHLNKGDIFYRKGLYDSARVQWQKCLSMRRTLYGNKHPYTAGANEALGKLYLQAGNLDSALFYRQALLRSQIRSFNEMDISRNPHPLQEEISLDLVDYLIQKAIAVRVAAGEPPDKPTLAIALNTYLLADSVYSAFQNNMAYDDLKLSLMEAGRVPYDDMLAVAFQLFSMTKERQYLQVAHNIMEHSRAVVLKNAISRADSFEQLGLPSAILNQEKALLQRRSDLLGYLKSNALGDGKRDSLTNEIITVDRDHERLKGSIAQEQPGYLHMRFGKDVRLDRLSSLMSQKQSLWIQYYWASDMVYALTVGATHSHLRSIPLTQELLADLESVGKEVSGFSDGSFTREGFDMFTKSAHSLFKTLVAPSLEGQRVQKLVISPSGPLMSFPFEALVTAPNDSGEIDFRLPYLVNTHVVSYQYSSSFLDREYARTRHGDKMLAIGHAASDPARDENADLPGAREEIAVIRAIMTNSENRYQLDEQASEQEFKTHAEKFNLLHLAVHGVADTVNEFESHLVFRTAGGTEDGKLFARELYTLDLSRADLAVLSACETGVGRVRAGEGIMSIARGFAYAGCPSMVVSLWKVSDKSASTLMTTFYQSVSRGEMIDAALAEAKRTYLQQTNMFNSHPAYWAAFLAIGETAAVVKTGNAMIATIALVLAIVALLAALWVVRNRKSSRPQLQPTES